MGYRNIIGIKKQENRKKCNNLSQIFTKYTRFIYRMQWRFDSQVMGY